MTLQIHASPKRVALALTGIALLLTIAYLVTVSSTFASPRYRPSQLASMFDLNREGNIPAWFSSSLLLLASLLLTATAQADQQHGGRQAKRWWGLALIFLLLSIDEAAAIHEMSVAPLRKVLHARGILYFPWVVPGSAFVLIVTAAYSRFLFQLPRRTRRLFSTAAVVYVGGALGMEMVGGYYRSFHRGFDATYIGFVAVEELAEMLGAILFVYALLAHAEAEAQAAPEGREPPEAEIGVRV